MPPRAGGLGRWRAVECGDPCAAWREADVLIPAGFTWRSCWAVTTRDSFQPSTLNYAVKVWGASEADKDARYQPTTPPRVPAKESPPKPLVGALQSSPSPALSLAALKESDWLKIGMGCSCSFSAGTPQKEKLIAGGDGLTFFRLNGKEHICPAPDTQSMFDGPVSMSCGSAAVQVTPYGKVEPGEDGHSSSARLHIADTSGTLSLTGTWGCGC